MWRLLLITSLLFGLDARAESDASRAFQCTGKVTKPKQEAVLVDVQKTYETVKSFRARFEQDSFLAALEAQEISAGTVVFQKPGMMQWRYESPEEQTFTLKDKTVWLYQPQVKQVMIDELSAVVISDLPVSFLMGLGNLSKDFTLKDGCTTSAGTMLELVPKASESEQNLKSFKLLVSPKDTFPLGAKITDVAGNVTTLLFKALDKNPALAEAEFTTKYPSGTDINDRRRRG